MRPVRPRKKYFTRRESKPGYFGLAQMFQSHGSGGECHLSISSRKQSLPYNLQPEWVRETRRKWRKLETNWGSAGLSSHVEGMATATRVYLTSACIITTLSVHAALLIRCYIPLRGGCKLPADIRVKHSKRQATSTVKK
jgi:hypothetical protein